MHALRLRRATAADATEIAVLHADSWRRHYRGAYADSFLDGDVAADRRGVWSARLAVPSGAAETVVAERDRRLVGFVHLIIDHDPVWGSLVDNLHVAHDQRRGGIGTRLLSCVAHAAPGPMYLWVLRQNTAAQQFYRALGARCVGTATVAPPGGDPARLTGTPMKLRMAWPDPVNLARLGGQDRWTGPTPPSAPDGSEPRFPDLPPASATNGSEPRFPELPPASTTNGSEPRFPDLPPVDGAPKLSDANASLGTHPPGGEGSSIAG